MSDTPMTDEAVRNLSRGGANPEVVLEFVLPEFARQLERDRARLIEALTHAADLMVGHCKQCRQARALLKELTDRSI